MTHPLPQPSDEAVSAACRAYSTAMGVTSPEKTHHYDAMRAALTAAHGELVAEVAALKRLHSNAEAQWRYMCEEISAAIGVNYDTPADAASAVRIVMQGAHVRDEQLSRLTAELAQREEAGARDAEDARRYRWLRNESSNSVNGPFVMMAAPGHYTWMRGERIDAAIDRAAKGKGNG